MQRDMFSRVVEAVHLLSMLNNIFPLIYSKLHLSTFVTYHCLHVIIDILIQL